jgi:hypothetical protein
MWEPEPFYPRIARSEFSSIYYRLCDAHNPDETLFKRSPVDWIRLSLIKIDRHPVVDLAKKTFQLRFRASRRLDPLRFGHKTSGWFDAWFICEKVDKTWGGHFAQIAFAVMRQADRPRPVPPFPLPRVKDHAALDAVLNGWDRIERELRVALELPAPLYRQTKTSAYGRPARHGLVDPLCDGPQMPSERFLYHPGEFLHQQVARSLEGKDGTVMHQDTWHERANDEVITVLAGGQRIDQCDPHPSGRQLAAIGQRSLDRHRALEAFVVQYGVQTDPQRGPASGQNRAPTR